MSTVYRCIDCLVFYSDNSTNVACCLVYFPSITQFDGWPVAFSLFFFLEQTHQCLHIPKQTRLGISIGRLLNPLGSSSMFYCLVADLDCTLDCHGSLVLQ